MISPWCEIGEHDVCCGKANCAPTRPQELCDADTQACEDTCHAAA